MNKAQRKFPTVLLALIFLADFYDNRANAQRDLAVAAAQNGAELAKFYAGDFSAGAADHGGAWDGNCWTFTNGACDVTITLLPGAPPYLGSAHIHAQADIQGPAVEFTVTWQKGHTHE